MVLQSQKSQVPKVKPPACSGGLMEASDLFVMGREDKGKRKRKMKRKSTNDEGTRSRNEIT